jgi:hypothetical protein
MGRSRVLCFTLLLAGLGTVPLAGQYPATKLPHNYMLLLDNSDVVVYRVHYGPHEFVAVHDHSAFSTVYIYLNDGGAVSFRHVGKKSFALTRPPTHAGAFRVSPGQVERHAVQSLSDQPSDFLRIELKRLPVHTLPAEFRGHAPSTPLTPGVSTPYDNPALRVERIVCPAEGPCEVAKEAAPSVLVAIPAGGPITASHRQKLTMDDPIVWLPTGTQTKLKSRDGEPIDLLRVVLPGQ